MALVVFLGDRFVAPDEAVVSIFDRGYLLGDSVFETLRAHEGKIFRVERHLERLRAAATALEIELPELDLVPVLAEAVARAHATDVYLRITLSRGEGKGLAITGEEAPTLSVIAREASAVPDAVASGIAETRRIPRVCLPAGIKTGNYLAHVLARRELGRRGLGEGVMLSVSGAVVSGTAANVFVVKGARIATPSLASGCRPGVVREALLEGIEEIEEDALATSMLEEADEIFFTSTQVGVLPAASFEGRTLRTDRSRALREAFTKLLRGS